MRIILSRKGFDSKSGGVPSPYLPSGELVSLPIPANKTCVITYSQIGSLFGSLGPIVSNLTSNLKTPVTDQAFAHLDPDLDVNSTTRPLGRWVAAFGQQTPGAVRALANVQKGDLFLFFGWFRQLASGGQPFVFKKGAPDLHVIFGWLQVGGVWNSTNFNQLINNYPGLSHHPHARGPNLTNPLNRIYTATNALSLPGVQQPYPGAGLFPFASKRVLTHSPANPVGRSLWYLPSWRTSPKPVPPLSSHHRPWRWQASGTDWILQSVGRGQEFVIDTSHPGVVQWAASLF